MTKIATVTHDTPSGAVRATIEYPDDESLSSTNISMLGYDLATLNARPESTKVTFGPTGETVAIEVTGPLTDGDALKLSAQLLEHVRATMPPRPVALVEYTDYYTGKSGLLEASAIGGVSAIEPGANRGPGAYLHRGTSVQACKESAEVMTDRWLRARGDVR